MNRSQARSAYDLPEEFFSEPGWAYYESSPEFAAETGARYIAVSADGTIQYLQELPSEADVVVPIRGSA